MMIDQLYKLIDKGSFRALSAILAITLTMSLFFNSYLFVVTDNGPSLLLTLWLIWGMVILWVHGLGPAITKSIWQLIFLPWMGYICAIFAIFYIYVYR